MFSGCCRHVWPTMLLTVLSCINMKMEVLEVMLVPFHERYFMAGAIVNVHSEIFITSFQCCSSHYDKNGDLVNCGTISGRRRVSHLWRLSLGRTLDCEHGNTEKKHIRKVSALQSYSNKSSNREAQLSDSTAAVPGYRVYLDCWVQLDPKFSADVVVFLLSAIQYRDNDHSLPVCQSGGEWRLFLCDMF